MTSQTLLALHAIANVLITFCALGLFWQAWKTERKAKKILAEVTAKNFMNRIFGDSPKPENVREKHMPDVVNSFKDRHEYSLYLVGLQGADPLTFPEWMEKRKEALRG